MNEEHLYEQLAHYMKLKYPRVIFHFDLSGVNNPSPRTRALYSRLNGRAWPDMFIYQPISVGLTGNYAGLAIELKSDKARVFTKDGKPASDHVREQQALLGELQSRGYVARIAKGFDEAVALIDAYLTVHTSTAVSLDPPGYVIEAPTTKTGSSAKNVEVF